MFALTETSQAISRPIQLSNGHTAINGSCKQLNFYQDPIDSRGLKTLVKLIENLLSEREKIKNKSDILYF